MDMSRPVPPVEDYWDFVAWAHRGEGDDGEQFAERLGRAETVGLGCDPWRLRTACERAAAGDREAQSMADSLALPLVAEALGRRAGLGDVWRDMEHDWYLKAR